MKHIALITGGCRSGKSRHALALAQQAGGHERFFVATCVPQDEEMHQRVARHQAERDPAWQTIEEPVMIADTIARYDSADSVILVDCLTLWTNNLLMIDEDLASIEKNIQQLTHVLKAAGGTVILVSNEVGMGIVPENLLARQFRDFAGFVNRRMAEAADRVIMTVAGLPVRIKPGNHP